MSAGRNSRVPTKPLRKMLNRKKWPVTEK